MASEIRLEETPSMEPPAAQMVLHALVAITTHNCHPNIKELNVSHRDSFAHSNLVVRGVEDMLSVEVGSNYC